MEKQSIKEITEIINKGVDLAMLEESLQNNVFEVEIDGTQYRVKKPGFSQKQAVYEAKMKKISVLIKEGELMFERDLRKSLKDRNVDIDQIEKDIIELEKKKKYTQELLGKALAEKRGDDELIALRDSIESMQTEQADLSIAKTQYLQMSIEHQVLIFSYSYLTTLVTEKLVDDTWVKVWPTYDDFKKEENESLVNKLSLYASLMIKDEIL